MDSWLAYSGIKQFDKSQYTQNDFYTQLSVDLIDNTYDNGTSTRRTSDRRTSYESGITPDKSVVMRLFGKDGSPRCGKDVHVYPCKKMRKLKDGTPTKQRHQGYGMIFRRKTTDECSDCVDIIGKELPTFLPTFICHPKTTRTCFATHFKKNH